MTTWTRCALVASLALAANVASAIPLHINVQTLALGGSQGAWSLTGTTPGAGNWSHLFLGSDSWDLDIQPGLYDWSISGGSIGLVGNVWWNLRLDGAQIYSDSNGGFLKFLLDGNHAFTAAAVPLPAPETQAPVALPEPQVLTLLTVGLGLLAFGLARKRRPSL
jgi:hypothetical protein